MTDEKDLLGLVDMTNEEYHSAPGISKSHLDVIASKSPKHYWQQYINPEREPRTETAAMKMGTAIHTAILEPHDMDNRIVCGLDIDRRSNENKAKWAKFEFDNKDKIIISAENYDHVKRIRDAVWKHPVASGLLTGGRAEQTFFAIDNETGELVKCRTDYMHDGGDLIVDVKSTDDASPHGFGKSAANYRYDVQTAWYYWVIDNCMGFIPTNWAFLAFEKEPPYAVGVYFITPEQIERAHGAAMRDYKRIVEAKRHNAWPDYGIEARTLELPAWCKR